MSDNDQEQILEDDILYSRETFQLLKEYYSLKSKKKRQDLLKLIRGMVEGMKGQ